MSITSESTNFQDVLVAYDSENESVTVTPSQVPKGSTVRFRDPKGAKLRIVFLSPMGQETDTVADSELCTLAVSGAYHFNCYFTPAGSKRSIKPSLGGVIDVFPHRP